MRRTAIALAFVALTLGACSGSAGDQDFLAVPTGTPTTAPQGTPAKATPKPTPKPTKKPKPKATKAPSSVYYANCAAVRAAGKDPLYTGDPGYRAGLDRDHDGVACE